MPRPITDGDAFLFPVGRVVFRKCLRTKETSVGTSGFGKYRQALELGRWPLKVWGFSVLPRVSASVQRWPEAAAALVGIINRGDQAVD